MPVKKRVAHILSKHTLENIINLNPDKPGRLLTILENTQEKNKYKYLPEVTLNFIADTLKITRAQVYSVVTFYSFFNLSPQGEHTITICRGTACHTRGSKKILMFVSSFLGLNKKEIEEGNTPITTPDFMFTLRTVACFGQCALAPVIEIDDSIYSNVTEEQLKISLENIKRRR